MLSLVDTYLQEIAAQGTPSLRAFISWVDSLRDASDDNATAPDTPVDVVLMTVHQSKGLEWDAVAVVGMRDGTFPSSQGDRLSVKTDEDHPGGRRDGVWEPPEYFEKPTLGWKTRPRCRFRCAPTRISCHDSRTTRPSGQSRGIARRIGRCGSDRRRGVRHLANHGRRRYGRNGSGKPVPDATGGIRPPTARRRTPSRLRGVDSRPLRGAARIQRMQRDEPRLPPGGGKEKRRAVEFLAGDARFDERNRHRGTRTGQPVRRCGRLPAHAGT